MPYLLGRQVLAELYACDRERLDDEDLLRGEAVAAAEAMGATVVGTYSHRYHPMGVSVVLILAESHLSLHTWPEHDLASVDIYVCNPAANPGRALAHLARVLKARRVADLELERGRLDELRRLGAAAAAAGDGDG